MIIKTSQQASSSSSKRIRTSALALSISAALTAPLAQATDLIYYESPAHVFSIQDVLRGFDAVTFADDQGFVCGLPDGVACPPEGPQPFIDQRTGIELFPVNSEFGFKVTDFVGAAELDADTDPEFAEGFVASVTDQGEVVGIAVSNAATKRFKTRAGMGTWCRGVGANDVKCSTEHFTVMEHVLSCYETVPYSYSDPQTGATLPIQLPVPVDDDFDPLTPPTDLVTPACSPLDTVLYEVVDGVVQNDCQGLDPTVGCVPLQPGPDGSPGMLPNEATVLNDIAVSADYSITKKDDGKPLYRWGSIVKRPTDIRLYARIPLPDEWKQGVSYEVISAQLVTDHNISNNPNDQVRPEDYENEGATGRLPEYIVVAPDDPLTEVDEEEWVAARDCFEGDGDSIIGDDDIIPDPLPTGTYFKNYFDEQTGVPWADPTALDSNDTGIGGKPVERDPTPYSADLVGGFTNAWYTTINRDPFEPYSREILDDQGGVLREVASGPRWRLKSNKFGQDIPGLEIPLIECSPTPFQSDNIKYEVGEPTITTLNLLDWESDNLVVDALGNPINPALDENGTPIFDPYGNPVAVSPLINSLNWVDPERNANQTAPGSGISVNGLPLSEDFDVAFYLKGERKAEILRTTVLQLTYRVEDPFDWGDAPAPYPTLRADDGARHAIIDNNGDGLNDLTLGQDADPELDGTPDPLAQGDDDSGLLDDEDGVVFSGSFAPGSSVEVAITSSGAGLINAWIDFNEDGDWDDPGEQIFVDQPVVGGVNTFDIEVPITANFIETYARFRLSSVGGLGVIGEAPDGEVEDYFIGEDQLDRIFNDRFEGP
jgi:hypothetical protein